MLSSGELTVSVNSIWNLINDRVTNHFENSAMYKSARRLAAGRGMIRDADDVGCDVNFFECWLSLRTLI